MSKTIYTSNVEHFHRRKDGQRAFLKLDELINALFEYLEVDPAFQPDIKLKKRGEA